MIDLFFLGSILFVFLILILRNNKLNYFLLVLYFILQFAFVYYIVKNYFAKGYSANYFLFLKSIDIIKYISIDKFTIFFLVITSILFFFSSISSISKIIFMKESNFSLYSSFLILFYISLFGVISSQNIIVLWIFIEATTLTGGILIYQDRTKHSLEAAWKYLFVCSVGIAISFVGIIFISLAYRSNSLSFSDLFALKDYANKFWLELGFGFILVGFGTKAGLAPTHAWLPDAHSEAPSQISALLSGALLNTALLGIIRILDIIPDSIKESCKKYLMIMGIISLVISAIYMSKSKNYKRLLAYSSIENMGLITLGISLGGLANYASYILIISHSLTKSSLFLTSGVIKDIYHTTESIKVNKLFNILPLAAISLIGGFLSISGFPVFLSFFAELKLIFHLIKSNNWTLLITILFFLLIILYSMAKMFFNMVFNSNSEYSVSDLMKIKTKKLKIINGVQIFSSLILILLALILGIYLPSKINDFILSLVNFIGV